MAASDGILFAGDVNVELVEIISTNGGGANVTNQVFAIEIYEDMFSPFISGVISLKDSLDYINLFPMIGEEFINLKISTPSLTGKGKVFDDQYYIFKLTNREMFGDRNVIYQIHFISKEAIVDLNKNVGTAFEGKISDIAKKLINGQEYGLESPKPCNIEVTPNGTKYVSNFWTPLENIRYISERAINDKQNPGYLFFESRNGFNFVSLDVIYSQDTVQDFSWDGWMRDFNPDGTSRRSVEEEYKRIIEVNVPTLFDYMERTRMGMYSSKIISHDLTTKKYAVKEFHIKDEYETETHLNEFAPYSDNLITKSAALLINLPKYYANFNNYTDITNYKMIQERMSLIQQAGATKINITVPGRTDYTVGNCVNVLLPQMAPIGSADTDTKDNMLSGKYCVSSINHTITKEKHTCYMELIKDSSIVDLNKGGI
jgi:hypothetical protein